MYLLQLFSENPVLRSMQLALLLLAVICVFLVFFAARDAILRSRSFWFQMFAVILSAALPVAGFLLYLLIRPSRTLRQAETDALVDDLHATLVAARAKKKKSGPVPEEPLETGDA